MTIELWSRIHDGDRFEVLTLPEERVLAPVVVPASTGGESPVRPQRQPDACPGGDLPTDQRTRRSDRPTARAPVPGVWTSALPFSGVCARSLSLPDS
jgi:hypothetical protein